MRIGRLVLLVCCYLSLHSNYTCAQLSSNGVNVTVSAGYVVPSQSINESQNKIVDGGQQASATAVARGNLAAGFASIGNVWVQGSAQLVPTGNLSQAGGEARSAVVNVTGATLVVEGLYATSGDASITAPNIRGGVGAFSFTIGNNGQWLIRATAYGIADGSQNPASPSSSSAVTYTTRFQNEPTKQLPGSSSESPINQFVGTPDQEIRRRDLDVPSFELPTSVDLPEVINGARLTSPIFGAFGQSSPLYAGPNVGNQSISSQLASRDSGAKIALSMGTMIDPLIPLEFQLPSAVTAYRYTISDNMFTHFILPEELPGGDNALLVEIGNDVFPYTPGELFDFTQHVPGGVAEFFLSGIDINEAFQLDERAPFVSGMRFAENGIANIEISPADIVIFVPEPGSASMAAFFAGLLAILHRKR